MKHTLANSAIIPPPLYNNINRAHSIAVGDSGTTDILLRQSASHLLTNVIQHSDLRVSLPDSTEIRSTHAGTLHVRDIATTLPAYVFPDNILQHNLMSFSALCNTGCTVTLTNTSVVITNRTGKVVFRGAKASTDTLWLIDLDLLVQSGVDLSARQLSATASMANLTVKLDIDAELVAFVHAIFGSPNMSTFLDAARPGVAGWPAIRASRQR